MGLQSYKNLVQIRQDHYSDRYLEFLKDTPDVESFDHTSFISDMIKVRSLDEGDILTDISFVPLGGECRMESFEAGPEFQAAAHPIALASANRDRFELSEGDDFTIIWDNKEFTFTLTGFYETGIWNYGTKAVISDEDFAYLENVMDDRYEIIGINTADGADERRLLADFKASMPIRNL